MASEPGPNAEHTAPGRVIGGKYRLQRQLAEGGMGAVWLARHEVLDVDVAVKLMAPEIHGSELGLARFEREAKASATLKSNHIVRVYDYGVDGDTPFMVMELLDGEDLGTRLERSGPMTVEAVVPILRHIAKGLEVAHAAGLVHRDLKPSNIFIAREANDEIVKLVDFGVARETKTRLVEDRTSSGVVLGSPRHMSPEQARGEPVDHRSDLWSLGVVLFRALTGQNPFESDVVATLMLAIVSKPVPQPSAIAPDLPKDIDRFFDCALHRTPARRFQSAGAMASALEAIANGDDITAFVTAPAIGNSSTAPNESDVAITGRDEATRSAMAPANQSKPEHRSDGSATRATSAVTANVAKLSRGGGKNRPWPWLAVALGLIVAAFFIGRSGGDTGTPRDDAGQATAAPAVEASASTLVPEVPPARAARTAAATTTSSALAPQPARRSTAAPPQILATPTVQTVAPAPPRSSPRTPTKAEPKIDPFTGLTTP